MVSKRPKTEARSDWKTRIFDCLSLPTLILRPNRIIVDVNACFLENFGVNKEDVLGKTCHDLFYHSLEPCPLEICALAKVLADRHAHSVLKYVTTNAGTEKWDNRFFSPILDEAGEVLYVVECIHDVTPVKMLERELSGARDFTEKLIQVSTTAIIAADMAGRILIMNPSAEELIGYSLKDAQGKITTEDLYPPGHAREVMKILRDNRMGDKGKLHLTRFTLMNAQGEEIPVDLTAAIIYEGDKEVATVGLFNDLREKLDHEQKKREMQVRISRAEKMASLGQLAAGVAHEINNPLTGILFYANLVLETLEKDDPRRKSLTCIYDDSRRCGKIIKNLLAYSRQATPSKDILQIDTILEHSLDLIRDRKFFVDILIVKEFSEEMMLIEGDKDQLSQVIVNLVLNAVDAMDQKGTLTLRTYRDKPAKKAYIEVSDTGPGIPEENIALIFDPFFTTKAPGKGTGLGLSTAYGIVRESGGHIWVKESGKGGTTFVVELPLYQPPSASNPRS
ncbi:MAG: ATP-binding protein [Syntrophobacteraceae bacterium]